MLVFVKKKNNNNKTDTKSLDKHKFHLEHFDPGIWCLLER